MIKLLEILQDILLEKNLCPKGKAYYDRRIDAGEKPSAYLSGRAVKVCKGLMEEDDLYEAKQVGILYHYTENWLLEQIIDSNMLEGPVSFTRSKDKETVFWIGAECSLVVDGDKLSNNYKIRPYQSYDEEGNYFDEISHSLDSNSWFSRNDNVDFAAGKLF